MVTYQAEVMVPEVEAMVLELGVLALVAPMVVAHA